MFGAFGAHECFVLVGNLLPGVVPGNDVARAHGQRLARGGRQGAHLGQDIGELLVGLEIPGRVARNLAVEGVVMGDHQVAAGQSLQQRRVGASDGMAMHMAGRAQAQGRQLVGVIHPADEAHRVAGQGQQATGGAIYEYEPSEEEILADLLPRNVAVQIFRAMLENAASEQGARMSAMDNATRNAGDMINRLTLSYNRQRQAQITKELIEIISGAQAV